MNRLLIILLFFVANQINAQSIAVNSIIHPCAGMANGTITVTGTGCAGTILYQLNGGAFQPIGTFTSLVAGVYTVTANDGLGCSTTTSITLNSDLAVNASPTDPICNGSCNGDIIALGSGGNGSYQYNLNNQGYLANGTYNSICGGSTYTVVVKDGNNCTASTIVSVNEPPVLTVTLTPTNPLCFNTCNGTIAASGNGGTPTYQYKINTGVYTFNTNFINRCAGTYTVTVKDNNGCTASATTGLVYPPIIVVNVTKDTICPGATNGMVDVTATGGTPGYTYAQSISGIFQSSSTLTNLSSGIYTVVVKDANNCTRTKTTTISVYPAPVITTNITNNKCDYLSTGVADIDVTTGVSPYLYNIDNSPYQVSDTFNGLPNGGYQLYILDGLGCENTYVINISSPPHLSIVGVPTHITCYDADNGSILVGATGGTPSYIFAYNSSPFQSTVNFSPLAPSTYTLYVKDTNSCIDSTYVTLTEPTNMYFDTSSVVPATFGSNGAVFVNAVGGTPSYQYNINGGPFQLSGFFDLLPGGIYTVMVTDDNNCTESKVFTVEFPTNVNDLALQNAISIYPNPVSGNELFLKINSEQPLGEINIKVFDILGQQILNTNLLAEHNVVTKKIELANLSNAYYNLVVTDKQNRIYKAKLIYRK